MTTEDQKSLYQEYHTPSATGAYTSRKWYHPVDIPTEDMWAEFEDSESKTAVMIGLSPFNQYESFLDSEIDNTRIGQQSIEMFKNTEKAILEMKEAEKSQDVFGVSSSYGTKELDDLVYADLSLKSGEVISDIKSIKASNVQKQLQDKEVWADEQWDVYNTFLKTNPNPNENPEYTYNHCSCMTDMAGMDSCDINASAEIEDMQAYTSAFNMCNDAMDLEMECINSESWDSCISHMCSQSPELYPNYCDVPEIDPGIDPDELPCCTYTFGEVQGVTCQICD